MMASSHHVFLLLVPILAAISSFLVGIASGNILMCAFNVQTFGATKMGKPEVMARLATIVGRYDLCFIQEIRSSSGAPIPALLDLVNDGLAAEDQYKYNMSEPLPLGSGSYKERYALMYNPKVEIIEVEVWDDTVGNVYDFERHPYVARIEYIACDGGTKEVGFIGIHVKPQAGLTWQEIDGLVDVYNDLKTQWNLENFIIGGDLNAAKPYLRDMDWPDVRLVNAPFTWLISNDTTTMVVTDKAYDRLIIAGVGMDRIYRPGTAQPYDFEVAMGLTEAEAKAVSDHLPVEMELN